MSRGRSIVAGVVFFLLAAGLASVLLLRGADTSAEDARADAQAVTTALARLATTPDDLIAQSAREHVRARGRQAVLPGSAVAADGGSWSPDGLGGGTIVVDVTPPAGATQTYVAVMVKEPDGWKVVGTVPLDAAGPGR